MSFTALGRFFGPASLLVVYLAFPIIIGIHEGLREGFLPALLWPVPVVLAFFVLGGIPLWAAEFGDAAFLSAWVAEIIVLAAATGALASETDRRRAVFAVGFAIMAVANIALAFIFPPDFDVKASGVISTPPGAPCHVASTW